MNPKIRLFDILIDSIYLASDEDSSILSDDPRLKEKAFQERISLVVNDVEKLIGQKKRQFGLDRGKRIENLMDQLREMGSSKAKEFLQQFSPAVEEQAVLQFYRKLSDDSTGESLDQDRVYLAIIENIESLDFEEHDEKNKS